MTQPLPQVYIVRHGETPWSLAGQHTGLTNILLTQRGEDDARHLAQRLKGLKFDHVFSSTLKRAWRTCELAGFGDVAIQDHDLVEWDYGEYEGKTSAEIHRQHPYWTVFQHGCPGGESVSQVAERADRIITQLRTLDGDALLFSHSHFLRMFTARWLGLDASSGSCFLLNTAALSIVGYEHNRDEPVIRLWNDSHHLGGHHGR